MTLRALLLMVATTVGVTACAHRGPTIELPDVIWSRAGAVADDPALAPLRGSGAIFAFTISELAPPSKDGQPPKRPTAESDIRRVPDSAALRIRKTLLRPSSYPSGVSCGPFTPGIAFVVPDGE